MTNRSFLRRLLRNKIGSMGAVIVLLLVLVAALAPLLAPYDPIEMCLDQRLKAPNQRFLLGTDEFGRDVLSRIIYGTRISLQVGIIAVGIGMVTGVLLGTVAGYFGGAIDNVIMRVLDVFFAFPAILLALVVVAMLGPGIGNTMLAIGVVSTPRFARVVRGTVLSVKENEFVQAARSMGARAGRIIFLHVLPNASAPVIVQATLALATAMLTEASLSFLGLGTQPPAPSWGTMLSTSRRFVELAPWTSVFPGVAISLAILGFNLFGDGLRDVLDPRLRS